MDIKAATTTAMHLLPPVAPDDLRTEPRSGDLQTAPYRDSQTILEESVVQPADDADGMFTHAPVSLWEEDFSELKSRFEQLKANGVEDLRKHFKKHPEEVLTLARMVKIVRVNKETLALYDAAGPVEFREGLSPIFSKDSYEVFREELIAFWKGKTSFTSEAVNLTLAGTSKNILIHVIIPPGYELTWAKVYIAITDITAIKDSMKNLTASEQKYRSVFDAVQTAVLLADVPSGMIVEANKSARRLFGASNGELTGRHLADLVQSEERDRLRSLLRPHPDRSVVDGQVLRVRNRSNDAIPVHATATTIDGSDVNVIVVSLTPAAETTQRTIAEGKSKTPQAGPGRKLSQREREILRLICSGKSSRTIAQHLCISDKTVDTHRTRIMQKLDTHCVVDLVNIAIANGLAKIK